MQGYLGEKVVTEHEYKDYTPEQWALFWIRMYGGIDGAHHKDWVLDQVARILNGVEVIVSEASWDNGHSELRFNLASENEQYVKWVADCMDGEDGPETYSYDIGTPP